MPATLSALRGSASVAGEFISFLVPEAVDRLSTVSLARSAGYQSESQNDCARVRWQMHDATPTQFMLVKQTTRTGNCPTSLFDNVAYHYELVMACAAPCRILASATNVECVCESNP